MSPTRKLFDEMLTAWSRERFWRIGHDPEIKNKFDAGGDIADQQKDWESRLDKLLDTPEKCSYCWNGKVPQFGKVDWPICSRCKGTGLKSGNPPSEEETSKETPILDYINSDINKRQVEKHGTMADPKDQLEKVKKECKHKWHYIAPIFMDKGTKREHWTSEERMCLNCGYKERKSPLGEWYDPTPLPSNNSLPTDTTATKTPDTTPPTEGKEKKSCQNCRYFGNLVMKNIPKICKECNPDTMNHWKPKDTYKDKKGTVILEESLRPHTVGEGQERSCVTCGVWPKPSEPCGVCKDNHDKSGWIPGTDIRESYDQGDYNKHQELSQTAKNQDHPTEKEEE